jgi:hypothetical protein
MEVYDFGNKVTQNVPKAAAEKTIRPVSQPGIVTVVDAMIDWQSVESFAPKPPQPSVFRSCDVKNTDIIRHPELGCQVVTVHLRTLT